MKNLSVFILAFLLLGATSCEKELFGCLEGSGEIELRIPDLPFFNKIDLKMEGEVFITEGPELEVRVEGHANIIDRILEDSEVVNEEWIIDLKGCSRNNNVTFLVSMPELKALEISGQGLMQTSSVLKNIDVLDLRIDGTGQMNIQVDQANKLAAVIAGNGKINLSGTTKEKDVKINGDGIIHAFDLISEVSRIKISGTGDCETYTETLLNIDFNGTGTVCYKGSPTLNINNSGQGIINDCN